MFNIPDVYNIRYCMHLLSILTQIYTEYSRYYNRHYSFVIINIKTPSAGFCSFIVLKLKQCTNMYLADYNLTGSAIKLVFIVYFYCAYFEIFLSQLVAEIEHVLDCDYVQVQI